MTDYAAQMAVAALTLVESDWLSTGTIKPETADRVIAAMTQLRIEWKAAQERVRGEEGTTA